MSRLSDLLAGIVEPPAERASAWRTVEVRAITADSRSVAPGALFAALPGSRNDGRHYVADAVARGAVAVLIPTGAACCAKDATFLAAAELAGLPIIRVAEPRLVLSRLAARFHGPQPAHVVAVTGTNGKTSVASFARQLWLLLGQPAASIGTLGVVAPDRPATPSLTTPDPVTLHAELAELATRGVDHVAVEASSHGLHQYRLDGLALDAAAFTNLTRDHLDYHGDMAAYFAAKAGLFERILPTGGAAVINADDPHGEALVAIAKARRQTEMTYGLAGRALTLVARAADASGQTLTLRVMGRTSTVRLPLIGAFQAHNALAALGLVIGSGADAARAVEALAGLEGVPGRLQRVGATAGGAEVLVDYAHTPDALETVLLALRPHVTGRLGLVFGCGGDRDPGKRPLMGAIAARLADWAIVTDDNPRTESPAAIRAAAIEGAGGLGPDLLEIGDRAAAIRAALARAGAGDVVIIAGKGHEPGQTIGTVTHPFDDVLVAGAALAHARGERA